MATINNLEITVLASGIIEYRIVIIGSDNDIFSKLSGDDIIGKNVQLVEVTGNIPSIPSQIPPPPTLFREPIVDVQSGVDRVNTVLSDYDAYALNLTDKKPEFLKEPPMVKREVKNSISELEL